MSVNQGHRALHTPVRMGRGGEEFVLLRLMADRGGALAILFAAAGTQGLVIMALPHWPVTRPVLIVAVAGGALGLSPVMWVLRRRSPVWSHHLIIVLGTASISLAVYGCGPTPVTMAATYFYSWMVLYAAAYFPPVLAATHLSFIAACYATALTANPARANVGQWIQGISGMAITALIIGGFAFATRRTAVARHFQAFHDPLTNLPNRALFLDLLDQALRPLAPQLPPAAVLYVDVDDFKTINDSLGYPVGDQLLGQIAVRLQAIIGTDDVLARLGGDEFALLLQHGPMPHSALDLAARAVAIMQAPFQLGRVEVSAHVSIGISVTEDTDAGSQDLLRDADLAMYLAKHNGKNRFEMVRPGMRDEALRRLALVTDLGHALGGGQMEVYYQAIVRVSDTAPAGAEALIRWHHPDRGLVLPDDFIAVAESSGLIIALGDWVLNQACQQTEAWRRAGTVGDGFYISVNLSPCQLAEPGLVGDVARALAESGLPARCLVLEITESSLMSDFNAAVARLRSLKDLGVRLALDDYGTGYSSLNRLRTFSFDIVKIDKSFIDALPGTVEQRALVRSVIDLTRALGMISIAEGVEQRAQFTALEELHCDAIQGFLFARPTPAADTARTLRQLEGDPLRT